MHTHSKNLVKGKGWVGLDREVQRVVRNTMLRASAAVGRSGQKGRNESEE
jgi:hypothetical protein